MDIIGLNFKGKMMRRPIVIIIGFLVLIFAILIVFFGLKGPEMPIQEVHKVIPMSKLQQETTTPALPNVPSINVPTNNIQQNVGTPQPLPAIPQPGSVPAGATNTTSGQVAQPATNNVVPQTPVPATQQPQSAPQVTQPTVPLIIPQPGSVPANATGTPQQR